MSSCGNPSVEADALMHRRPKFDKSKNCVKCKLALGNVVIRHAVYCKACFPSVVVSKFRRTLGPTVNPTVNGRRRKQHQAEGNLLVAFSGGLGSTVLLDLVSKCYFRSTGAEGDGKDHPRNGRVWRKAAVCYVEVCNAFPGMRDKTEAIRAVVEEYDEFEFIPLRVEDAFDLSWWRGVGGRPIQSSLGVDLSTEELLLSSTDHNLSPIASLRSYITSLPTHTAVSTAIQNLVRVLLLHTASSTGSSHLLLGTSMTSLSIALISSISQGGGFVVSEEAEEEWKPLSTNSASQRENPGVETIRIIRPLRDVGVKECALWAWWYHVKVTGRERFPNEKQGIGGLTKSFIIGLEHNYPSTVPAITRTCGKLMPKKGSAGSCPLCDRPVQRGVQDWKARISIRTLAETGKGDVPPFNSPPSEPRSLASHLCYSCNTTLTSRSSRGTSTWKAAQGDENEANVIALPVWLESGMVDASRGDTSLRTGEIETKDAIAQFLLD